MKLLRVCSAAFLFALVLVPAAAHAAVTLVLQLDGIQGESTIPGYENQIVLSSVSFSVEQAVALKEAGKGGLTAAKAAFTPITIEKGADKASPQLFLSNLLGKPIKRAKLSFLAPNDGPSSTPVEFFSISLANIFISKFGVAASLGDDNTQEQVTLNYGMLLLTYTPALGTPITKGFDLIKNKEISDLPPIITN